MQQIWPQPLPSRELRDRHATEIPSSLQLLPHKHWTENGTLLSQNRQLYSTSEIKRNLSLGADRTHECLTPRK